MGSGRLLVVSGEDGVGSLFALGAVEEAEFVGIVGVAGVAFVT